MPNRTEATPCQKRANVDLYAKTASAVAHAKSQGAVAIQVMTTARAT